MSPKQEREISPEMLKVLLRYAFPCTGKKMERGELKEADIRMLEAHLKEGKPLTKSAGEILRMFPVAVGMIKVAAKLKDNSEIKPDHVRSYFWFHHDTAIDERVKNGEVFNAKECEVRSGKLRSATPTTASVNIDGEDRFFDNSIARIVHDRRKEQYVTVHFNHVCEEIEKDKHEKINARKEERQKKRAEHGGMV
jgi:hypothetical protein